MSSRWWAALAILTGLAAAPAPAQEQIGWAHKMFDKLPTMEYDFGTVPRGTLSQHRFVVTNIYQVPLTVQTRVSCDCVSVTLPKQTLQSREASHMDVQMDARKFTGKKEVQVYFTVTGQQGSQFYSSTAILTLRAFCRTDVGLNPGALNFGIVPRGQTPLAAVDIEYKGQLQWQLSGPTHSDLFKVDVVENHRYQGGVKYRAQLTLKPDAPAGSHKQELQLSTNDPTSPTVPIPFEVTVMPALTVSPAIIKLSTKVGEPKEGRILISGSSSCHIAAVEGQGDGLTIVDPLPTAGAKKPRHVLVVRWMPTAPGPLSRTLTIKTDNGATEKLTVEGTTVP